MPMPPRSLEGKTLDYWRLQMHWNGHTAILKQFDPFLKPPTVQDAIAGCNAIMANLDPKRSLSQRAFHFQDEVIKHESQPPTKGAKAPPTSAITATPNISA